MTAFRTLRASADNSGRTFLGLNGFATLKREQLVALASPVILEQWRDPEDDDIEKAANQEAKNKHP